MIKIADSGFLIALLDERDRFHSWASKLATNEEPPWLVCEPVLTEVAAMIGTPEPILEMLTVGDLEAQFDLNAEKQRMLALVRKYRDQGMDLADAAVVRMSELQTSAVVFTVDRVDFLVYRRNGNRPIPCAFPNSND